MAVYGAKIMKDLGLIPAGYKIMVVGSVQEEDCDMIFSPSPIQPMTLPRPSISTLS